MTSQTQGIQQLLTAEKKAHEKVAEARLRKVLRIKQAREQAKTEIEKYREDREKQYKEFEIKHMDSNEDVASRADAMTSKSLEDMEKIVSENMDAVAQRLVDVVLDIKPELHKNFVKDWDNLFSSNK